MKEGIISYKFASEKYFDTIKFTGDTINIRDLKRLIEEKRMSNTNYINKYIYY